MDDKIARAKALLEERGYVVARKAKNSVDPRGVSVGRQLMQSRKLQEALKNLKSAIQEVKSWWKKCTPRKIRFALHIFVSRRNYRNANDTKSGKRREVAARLSYNEACALGFRGSFEEWERLLGAVARR